MILPMKHFSPVLALILCLFLNACGNKDNNSSVGLTPLPDARQSPPDSALVDAINGFIVQQGAPANSEYNFSRVDLNNDGRQDGIVLFKLPHTYWCGWDGCGMAIFEATNNSFIPHSTINNVRGPIYVDSDGYEGWRNIIIRVSGTNMPDKDVVMVFDGHRYPQSPMLARTLDVPIPAYNTMKLFR